MTAPADGALSVAVRAQLDGEDADRWLAYVTVDGLAALVQVLHQAAVSEIDRRPDDDRRMMTVSAWVDSIELASVRVNPLAVAWQVPPKPVPFP